MLTRWHRIKKWFLDLGCSLGIHPPDDVRVRTMQITDGWEHYYRNCGKVIYP